MAKFSGKRLILEFSVHYRPGMGDHVEIILWSTDGRISGASAEGREGDFLDRCNTRLEMLEKKGLSEEEFQAKLLPLLREVEESFQTVYCEECENRMPKALTVCQNCGTPRKRCA